MFSCDDISAINVIRLISNPVRAPSHEFDEIEIFTETIQNETGKWYAASSL
jgi:hypothetical protein